MRLGANMQNALKYLDFLLLFEYTEKVKDMQKVSRQYIVVTPCKNEEDNLSNLIQSMMTQTIKPVLWVIVDDGSTDNTPKIIDDAKKKYNRIKGLRLKSSKRDLGLHFAEIFKKGLDFAIEYCSRNKIDWNYLGCVDGDLTLEETFFEYLIKEFENDPELGIAGGGVNYTIGNRLIYSKEGPNEPSGGNMLVRRTCLEECGGIPHSYTWDSVLKAKARIRGWKTRRFEDVRATEIRDAWSAEGYWKGYFHSGESAYYRNLNPIHVLINGVRYSFKRPFYIGIPYLLGYFGSALQRKPQIDDDEIKKYYWNKWKEHIFS